MGLLKTIKNLFKKKEIVHVQLDPESVKSHNTIKALANENAELKGELGRVKSELGKRREADDDLKEEDEVKKNLDDEKKQIISGAKSKFFSLGSFYRALFFKDGKNKFARNLYITTFNRGEKIAKFIDFGFSYDGGFVLLGRPKNSKANKPEIILKTGSLKEMFQSVGALGNDIESYKIPVNLDENGIWIDNIMEYEAPELISTGTTLKYAKARKKPVYEIIANLNQRIGTLTSELEESEMLNIELQNKVDTQERLNNIYTVMLETAKVEVSKTDERMLQIDKIFRDTEKELSHLRMMNIINEDNSTKLEREIQTMRKQAEDARTITEFNQVIHQMDSFKDLLKEKRYLPPQITPNQQTAGGGK